MLVLSRKAQDTIVIGSDIRITVLSTSSGRVQIGIEAPQQVKVLRGELLAEKTELTEKSTSRCVINSVADEPEYDDDWFVPPTTLSA